MHFQKHFPFVARSVCREGIEKSTTSTSQVETIQTKRRLEHLDGRKVEDASLKLDMELKKIWLLKGRNPSHISTTYDRFQELKKTLKDIARKNPDSNEFIFEVFQRYEGGRGRAPSVFGLDITGPEVVVSIKVRDEYTHEPHYEITGDVLIANRLLSGPERISSVLKEAMEKIMRYKSPGKQAAEFLNKTGLYPEV